MPIVDRTVHLIEMKWTRPRAAKHRGLPAGGTETAAKEFQNNALTSCAVVVAPTLVLFLLIERCRFR